MRTENREKSNTPITAFLCRLGASPFCHSFILQGNLGKEVCGTDCLRSVARWKTQALPPWRANIAPAAWQTPRVQVIDLPVFVALADTV